MVDMNVLPTQLQKLPDDSLAIDWSDGSRRIYAARELRDACPCATCREKQKAPPRSPMELPLLSPGELRPLEIARMRPVGNYAYGIAFSDGHDTGLYTLDLLRQLGTEATPPGEPSTGAAP